MSSRAILISMGVSLALHGATGAMLRVSGAANHSPISAPAITIDFEYGDLAPEPPTAEELEGDDAAEDPTDEDDGTAGSEDDTAEDMASGTIVPPQPQLPLDPSNPSDDEPIASAPMDAGVPPADGTALAVNDNDKGDGERNTDGGASVLGDLAIAATTDPESDAGDKFPGTQANLLSYMPAGDKITALIRFDRLRNTKWAAPGDKVLQPLPDYQTMLGGRPILLSDIFDTLVISTPSPSDVPSTVLVGHLAYADKQMRAFVDHKQAPVRWSASTGGPRGDRKTGPLLYPGDRRVFLMPYPQWLILADPRTIGDATLADVAGDVDTVTADASALPTWLAGVRTIETESGTTDGPLVIVTFRKLEERYEIPGYGELPGPDRMTVTLEIVKDGGLKLRGNMEFSDANEATEFVTTARTLRDSFVDSTIGELVLNKVHAHAALKGLTLRQSGARVSYGTSISDLDGLGLLEFAAGWLEAYFAERRLDADNTQKSKGKSPPDGEPKPAKTPK